MVRRWSYLNSVNDIFFNQYKSLNFVHYEQSFKTNIVFRKNISELSSISRKSWSRRKHLTNWMIYQNVLTDWSKDYTFFKKYNRFILIFQMFRNSFLTYNVFLIKKLNTSSSVGSEKIIFSSLTTKLIKYNAKYSTQFYTFLNYYKSINWLYITSPTKIQFTQPQAQVLVTPLIYTYQNSFYQPLINFNDNYSLQLIYQILFDLTTIKLTELYKLTILLRLPLLNL